MIFERLKINSVRVNVEYSRMEVNLPVNSFLLGLFFELLSYSGGLLGVHRIHRMIDKKRDPLEYTM
jgi:hypothetical protein